MPRHNLEINGGPAEGRVFGREEGRVGLDIFDVIRLLNRFLLGQRVDHLLAVEVRDPGGHLREGVATVGGRFVAVDGRGR